MKSNYLLPVLAFLTVLIFSCGPNGDGKPTGFDYGHVENSTYVNSFFGVELKLPTDWIVQSKEEIDKMAETGKDVIAGDNKSLKAAIDAAEINTANLLSVFKYEVGTAVEFNPNFMLVAENLKHAPGIKNGSDYLFQSRKILKQSQIQYESIDENFEKVMLNGHEFYTMNTLIDYMGVKIQQRYYSTIQNGFCLSAIISYTGDEQKKELEALINSLEFDK